MSPFASSIGAPSISAGGHGKDVLWFAATEIPPPLHVMVTLSVLGLENTSSPSSEGLMKEWPRYCPSVLGNAIWPVVEFVLVCRISLDGELVEMWTTSGEDMLNW
jgi:hypothetical protein